MRVMHVAGRWESSVPASEWTEEDSSRMAFRWPKWGAAFALFLSQLIGEYTTGRVPLIKQLLCNN